MAEYALARPMPAKRAITLTSAFGGGLANGALIQRWPMLGTVTTIVSAIGGTVLSMFTRGVVSEIMEGVGAGAIGTLGFVIPAMFKTGATTGGNVAETMARVQAQRSASMKAGVGLRIGAVKKEFQDVVTS